MTYYKYMGYLPFFDSFKIRFTQPEDLNDTRECRPTIEVRNPEVYIDAMEKRQKDRYRDEFAQIYPHLNPEQLSRVIDQAHAVQRDDFQQNRAQWIQKIKDIIMKNVNRYVGVLSLTKKNNDLKMWWDYSNHNKGYMIEFAEDSPLLKKRETDNPECGEILPVEYDNRRPTVHINPGALDIPKELFWWKTEEWASESEYRMIRNLQSADLSIGGGIFLWNLVPGDLIAVYLGSAFPDDQIGYVKEKCVAFDPNITVYKMRVNDDGDIVPEVLA
ncbi:MAG: DUF2971 domain-containing protein [Verrucomicrobia bacterium]|nr:DUF2971 domain-containing protein [Verrucomicrobiota bacterium]MCH8528379.1 DUF2971 domain-containing protein [Kiritimatiellia bacterium]